jgi:hypothetical protein
MENLEPQKPLHPENRGDRNPLKSNGMVERLAENDPDEVARMEREEAERASGYRAAGVERVLDEKIPLGERERRGEEGNGSSEVQKARSRPERKARGVPRSLPQKESRSGTQTPLDEENLRDDGEKVPVEGQGSGAQQTSAKAEEGILETDDQPAIKVYPDPKLDPDPRLAQERKQTSTITDGESG